jgi:hypothetical protein
MLLDISGQDGSPTLTYRLWCAMTGSLFALALSLLMLAVIALVIGGGYLIVKRRDIRRGTLMLVAAAVFLGNVLILSWPAG